MTITKSSANSKLDVSPIYTKRVVTRRFLYPREHGAWWTFATCIVAGLLAVSLAGGDIALALSLAIPMVSVFLISDWISALSGAFLDERIHADLKAVQPWAFMLVSLGCLIYFAFRLPQTERTWWASVMVVQVALISSMFVLRQELPSRDIRLLLLSSLMLTSPALLLGASALGWSNTATWEFWIWPALYYPAGVLYVKGWMGGKLGRNLRFSSATLPYIVLASLAGLRAHWLAVGVFAIITVRAVVRIRRRLLDNGSRIPSIKEIRRFGWEQVSLSLLFTVVWLWTFLGGLSH